MKKKKVKNKTEWTCTKCKGIFDLDKKGKSILKKSGGVIVDCPYCKKEIICGKGVEEGKIGNEGFEWTWWKILLILLLLSLLINGDDDDEDENSCGEEKFDIYEPTSSCDEACDLACYYEGFDYGEEYIGYYYEDNRTCECSCSGCNK